MEENTCQRIREREQGLLSIPELFQLAADAVEAGGDSFLGLHIDRTGSVEFLFDRGSDKRARVRKAAVPYRLVDLSVERLGNANAAKSALFLHVIPAAKASRGGCQDL